MKIFIKTLKGTHFDVQVELQDKIADVKRKIENIHGKDVYPCSQQMLIHQGKVLKDESTLDDYKVVENDFFVIMLSKPKSASSGGSTTSTHQLESSGTSFVSPSLPVSTPQAPAAILAQPSAAQAVAPPATAMAAPVLPAGTDDVYGQAASNLVAGSNFEEAVQQILDVGGGSWDRDMVVRALRAAFNNPERAIEYLYSGIPDQGETPTSRVANVPVTPVSQPAQTTSVPAGTPNANPLDLFPQGIPNMEAVSGGGTLDFLRNSQQFQMLRAMVQQNPEILQPMLQELGKQNPHLVRLIQEHQSDFLRLLNEPVEGADSNLLGQLAADMPQAVSVTPEEREAIERLEAMGFDRAIVLQVFFACNKNEELAANYLLDHMNEFEEQ